MRICVVYDCLFPYTVGGAERWYRNLAERLVAEGHDVTYLTLRQWDRGESVNIDQRIRVVAVGPRMALYTDRRRRLLPPLVFGAGVLAHLLRHRRRYDAIHTCAFPYFSVLAIALVRPLLDVELVVDWFEVWSRSYWTSYLGGLGGRLGAMIQRACARVRQSAFCFSRLHAARLRQEGLRGTLTILGGLYSRETEPASPREADPLVVFAGRLIPEKRAVVGVAAVVNAAKRIPELRGVFYGEGPEHEALRAAVADYGAESFIATPGFVDVALVDRDLRRAICMLLPSRREGYGMVVVEAAAEATPSVVVASEDNAATELVEDGVNGLVVAEASPEALADAIVRIHHAGLPMRQSTARWYSEHARELSLESSLAAVLASYGSRAGHSSLGTATN
ncbi:MAG TPA: glycosyltransferase [Solirubrobacteraceae bacterium]|nr:glycosyltransferase [Solirubrobacteraceae bacterium]